MMNIGMTVWIFFRRQTMWISVALLYVSKIIKFILINI